MVLFGKIKAMHATTIKQPLKTRIRMPPLLLLVMAKVVWLVNSMSALEGAVSAQRARRLAFPCFSDQLVVIPRLLI